MRRTWISLAMLAGLGTVGCYSTPMKRVKRPELVQEYKLPPENDPRFSQPPALPTKVLLDDPLVRRREMDNAAKDLRGPMTMPGQPGAMPGPMP